MKIRKISKQQEKEVAEKFSGKTTIASGALWFQKADFRSEKVLGECKTTSKDHFSVNTKIWEKIEEEALKDNMKIPLLIIDLNNKDRFVIFKDSYFDNIFSYEMCVYEDRESKSKRIFAKDMQKIYPLDAKEFFIKGKKEHKLYCMPIDTFLDIFGGEI